MIYEYQCNCGIRFEASASMADHQKPQPCPGCAELAPRNLPQSVSGFFSVSTSGIGPQNTGISEIDANIDRIIGADARKGWAAIEDRNTGKSEVLHNNPGASPLDLSKNPDGSYRVMKDAEKRIHARAFTINAMAMGAKKKAAAPR